MNKLFYCLECRRIFKDENQCSYCGGKNIKELVKNSPVNLIGSKLKGKVLRIEENKVRVLFTNDSNDRFIKEQEPDTLRKVL